MNVRRRVSDIFWCDGELCIIGAYFLILFLTNAFWTAVLPPYGYVLWPIVAQIIYWWRESKKEGRSE